MRHEIQWTTKIKPGPLEDQKTIFDALGDGTIYAGNEPGDSVDHGEPAIAEGGEVLVVGTAGSRYL